MTLNEVQADIRHQISYMQHGASLAHAVCGLCEEAGEVSGLLKRDLYKSSPQPRERWVDELGDVLWYLIAVADALDISMEEVFVANRRKLEERYGPFERKVCGL